VKIPLGRACAVTLLAITAVTAASVPAQARIVRRAAVAENYGQYSRMFERSAGQYWAGGVVAGQWTWAPQSTTTSDISWGGPATWPPPSAEHLIRSGDWVLLDGFSAGQGRPVTSVQRVTSESVGDANCGNMVPIPSDGGLQHYVRWTVPTTAYCLDAIGTITVGTAVVNFRHRQIWSPPSGCANAYITGQTCVTQHEQWWDDNGAPYAMRLDRTIRIARGLGMAFTIHQVYPSVWDAAGRYYWSY
jgi:hypothetical protein